MSKSILKPLMEQPIRDVPDGLQTIGRISSQVLGLTPTRAKGLGALRILFGLVWAVDAWFKWQPDFIHTFTDYLTGAQEGQPAAVQAWIGLWVNVVKVDPHAFGYLVALGETAIAIGLILGLFSNVTNIGGVLLSVVIWSTAEGFGGPYQPGSTDIGAAVIYALVFVGLLLSNAGLYWGLDARLTPALGRWGWLASGPLPADPGTASSEPQAPRGRSPALSH